MKIREQRLLDETVGYKCDVCGQPCFNEEGAQRADSTEHATLCAEWGYWSEKDGELHECHLCERCYDEVRNFIEKDLQGQVRVMQRWGPASQGG